MRAKDILGVWEKSTISEISQAPIDKIAPFKIRFDPVGRTNHVISKKLGSKFIAYFDPAPVKLQVGTRIIAVYMDPEDRNGREDFYSGIIAEPPKAMNRYRYLGTISMITIITISDHKNFEQFLSQNLLFDIKMLILKQNFFKIDL